MEQNNDISQQKPSSSGGQTGPKLARDVHPDGHKDVSNHRKCPDCDGRISKENKSKSRVWRKVMWFTRRSKTTKNDVCQCQTDESFSNIEGRHSNSWSFTRSASKKFRISSRKRQCKSESSKKSVRGKRNETCTSWECSQPSSRPSCPSMSTGSVSSSGPNSPTATGSFCDFGATSHTGARGSKGHKNAFVLTEIARAINPPVKNDALPRSDINRPQKQLSKSSSSVSHISRPSQSRIAGNVRRSKSFPGSQSSISASKRRFINTAKKTLASSSPPLKQKCYGLRRTATFSGKLNTEFPNVCLKKSKSVNAAEFGRLDRATSLGEIRDQSGSIVGIVHFYKSPKKLATRRMSSFNNAEVDNCMLEEDEFNMCNGDPGSSISNKLSLQASPSESKTVDVDPKSKCIKPETRPLSSSKKFSSAQLGIETLEDMKCGTNVAGGMPEILAESQGYCVSVNESFKDTATIIKESSSKADESLCCTLLSTKLDDTMNISNFKTVSEAVELSCGHDDQMPDHCHKDDCLLPFDSDSKPEFEILSVDNTSFSEGLEDSTDNSICLDNEIEITEQFESSTASDDCNLGFPSKKAKLLHSTTMANNDLMSLEVFDASLGCIKSVSKPESELALEFFDTPSSSAKSESGQGGIYEEGRNELYFSPQSSDNLTKITTPVVSDDEEFQRCVHSSPETLECSRTSGYVSMLEESQQQLQHVPIHTWKTSESLDMKSDDIGLPVPGQTFKMRTELMLSWFDEFNDEQRNIILKKILNRCELPQMHLLSVAMENNLHKTCPPNCQDMLVWLPYTVTLKILMYLDAASLCRCNQVNRAWNELADNPLLWQRLTRNPDYQLSEASSKRQYQKFTQANGEMRWKKVFAERYLLQRNWLNGKYKLRTFEGHNQGIACVQFDDTRIVSGSSDKTIKLWDISNTPSELMLTLEGHSGTVRCLDLNGNRLVSGSTDRTIKVWDLSFASYWAGASCKVTMVGHLHTVRCLQADEKKLVSGSYDKTVKVWDLKTGECRLTLRGHTAAVLCVQFDDQKIVSGSYDKKIKVWDLTEGTCLMTLDGHQDAVTCLNLTHDGMKIITGSLDYSLKFWDLSTGKCYGTLDWITSEGHTAVVRCLQVDSWRIVSGGDDKTLKVWELATGQRLLTLRYHSDGVTCMQFNDFAIVSGSYDRTVKLWDFTPKHPYLEAVT